MKDIGPSDRALFERFCHLTAGAAEPLLRQVPLRRRAGVDTNVGVMRSKAMDFSIDAWGALLRELRAKSIALPGSTLTLAARRELSVRQHTECAVSSLAFGLSFTTIARCVPTPGRSMDSPPSGTYEFVAWHGRVTDTRAFAVRQPKQHATRQLPAGKCGMWRAWIAIHDGHCLSLVTVCFGGGCHQVLKMPAGSGDHLETTTTLEVNPRGPSQSWDSLTIRSLR